METVTESVQPANIGDDHSMRANNALGQSGGTTCVAEEGENVAY